MKEIILQWKVLNKNLFVVPTGIDEKQLAGADEFAVRREYGIKDDEILLVTIARLTKEKNMQFLFEAVAQVLKENKKVKFLAGGGGDLTDKLKEFMLSKKIAKRVILPGLVPDEIKKNYYTAGDIFVFASKSEAQGMIISEAMYLGLPVVAIASTGVKDLVTNQVTGLLVHENKQDFVGAIRRLIEDKALRKKFTENAGKIARQGYTSKICTQRLLQVYEEAIKKNKERKG